MINKITIFLLLGLLIPIVVVAEKPSVELRVTTGASKIFLDETFHFAVGGSVNLRLGERIGIEPQFLYTNGPNFREYAFLGNGTFDLTDPDKNSVLYLIGGAGILNEFQKSIDFSSNEFTASGGLGLKTYFGKRMFFSPEIRFGSHAFPQLTASIGWTLSRNKD